MTGLDAEAILAAVKTASNKVTKFLNFLWNSIVPRGADPREVAAIVERAWIDNVEANRLGYAHGFARKLFNETVSEYVRGFHRRTGGFPVGDHDILGTRRRTIYFAPRPLLFSHDAPLLTR